jgi:hypothetical protein
VAAREARRAADPNCWTRRPFVADRRAGFGHLPEHLSVADHCVFIGFSFGCREGVGDSLSRGRGRFMPSPSDDWSLSLVHTCRLLLGAAILDRQLECTP